MKVYRVKDSTKLEKGSNKTHVLILDRQVTKEEAERLLQEFPNSLMIAENRLGDELKEGYLNVLRIDAGELNTVNKDNPIPYKAVLVENLPTMFYSELLETRQEIADKFDLPVERIRLCCNFASEQGSENLSCYAANALRDYGAEMGVLGVAPTSKQEILSEKSMCMCVKSQIV